MRKPYVPPPSRQRPPVQVSEIKAGHYMTKLVQGGPFVALKIEWSPPRDPATAELLDRSPRWMMCLDGSWTDRNGELWDEMEILHTFLFAAKHPISEQEYLYRTARQQHAFRFEPDLPEASPRKKVDLGRLKPLF